VTPASDVCYVAAVLVLYADLPDTPLRPSPQDQSLARTLYDQGCASSVVECALLLASLRP
jgi:hypothetical protein